MKWFRWLVAVGALLALVGLALALGWGRWSNPRPIVEPAVDLEAFNKARVARQSILIDSMTATGSWEQGPGGLKYRLLEEGTVEPVAVRRGDWVEWNVRASSVPSFRCSSTSWKIESTTSAVRKALRIASFERPCVFCVIVVST